jgi:hypothetical protein
MVLANIEESSGVNMSLTFLQDVEDNSLNQTRANYESFFPHLGKTFNTTTPEELLLIVESKIIDFTAALSLNYQMPTEFLRY